MEGPTEATCEASEEAPSLAVPGDVFSINAAVPTTSSTVPSNSRNETSAILKLKGLPYSTSEQEIRDFFADYKVISVRFVYEPDGRPSGLAFAEFESKDQAVEALSKNGEYMGERYVRLLHVPISEMEEQVRLGTLGIPGNAAKLRSRLAQQQQRNTLAYLTGPVQLVQTVFPSPRPLLNVGHALNSPYTGGMAPLETRVWQTYNQPPAAPVGLAAQFQNLAIGPLRQAMPRAHVMPQHPPPMSRNLIPQQPAQLLHAARPLQNPASATVKVRGLPYRSSPAEILHFFQGYQYLPDSLQIGLDSLGRPSGEAWLTFVNSPEALRAVRDLNRHYLGTRYLELSMC